MVEIQQDAQAHTAGEGLAQLLGGNGLLPGIPRLGLDVGRRQPLIVTGEHLVQQLQHSQHHVALILVDLALILGRQHLPHQVAVGLGGIGGRVVQVAVSLGDGHPDLQFGRFAHLLELVALLGREFRHAFSVTGDALDGQILLRHRHHVRYLVCVSHQEQKIVPVGAVALEGASVVGDLPYQVRRLRLVSTAGSGVIVNHHQFGLVGVVVHVPGLTGEEDRLEIAGLPHLANAPVQFPFGLDLAYHTHLIVDDLVQRRFGLETVAVAIPLEEPAVVSQVFGSLGYHGRIVVRLERGHRQVGWIHPGGYPLRQAVQEDSGGCPAGVGGLASVQPGCVNDLGMGL